MKATFLYSGNTLCGYALEGHCGGEAGSDIVCAAVSSAAYLTTNTITEILKKSADIAVDPDGRMCVRLSTADAPSCETVLQGFLLHMTALSKDYPQKIQLTKAEV